jgi:hypothetical protein
VLGEAPALERVVLAQFKVLAFKIFLSCVQAAQRSPIGFLTIIDRSATHAEVQVEVQVFPGFVPP